jgi:hypothetical protein
MKVSHRSITPPNHRTFAHPIFVAEHDCIVGVSVVAGERLRVGLLESE